METRARAAAQGAAAAPLPPAVPAPVVSPAAAATIDTDDDDAEVVSPLAAAAARTVSVSAQGNVSKLTRGKLPSKLKPAEPTPAQRAAHDVVSGAPFQIFPGAALNANAAWGRLWSVTDPEAAVPICACLPKHDTSKPKNHYLANSVGVCGKTIGTTASGIQNFGKHLKDVHGLDEYGDETYVRRYDSNHGAKGAAKEKYSAHIPRLKLEPDDPFVLAIVESGLPFRIVEKYFFRMAFGDKLGCASRKTLRNTIYELGEKKLDVLLDMLKAEGKTAGSICYDAGTIWARFLAFTLHVPGFPPIMVRIVCDILIEDGRLTSENIAKELVKLIAILGEKGFNIISVIADNAANMHATVIKEAIGAALKLRCFPHVLQLCVRDAIGARTKKNDDGDSEAEDDAEYENAWMEDEFDEAFPADSRAGDVAAGIIGFKEIDLLIRRLCREKKRLGSKCVLTVSLVATRWKAKYDLVVQAEKNWAAFLLQSDKFTGADLHVVKRAIAVLEPFAIWTDLTQGDSSSTFDSLLVISKFRDAASKRDATGEMMHKVFMKRESMLFNDAHLVVCFFAPWLKRGGPVASRSVPPGVADRVFKIIEGFVGFENFAGALSDEIERFKCSPPTPLPYISGDTITLRLYLIQIEEFLRNFPIILSIVHAVATAPPSEASVEREFSICKQQLSRWRARMLPPMVSALLKCCSFIRMYKFLEDSRKHCLKLEFSSATPRASRGRSGEAVLATPTGKCRAVASPNAKMPNPAGRTVDVDDEQTAEEEAAEADRIAAAKLESETLAAAMEELDEEEAALELNIGDNVDPLQFDAELGRPQSVNAKVPVTFFALLLSEFPAKCMEAPVAAPEKRVTKTASEKICSASDCGKKYKDKVHKIVEKDRDDDGLLPGWVECKACKKDFMTVCLGVDNAMFDKIRSWPATKKWLCSDCHVL